MSTGTGIAEKAVELRRAFDRSFAEAPHRDKTVRCDFLAVKIGNHQYAIHLSEIAGLFADKKITPVPGGSATLVGIAAFRRVILPVHDLRAFFGYPIAGMPRWLVVAATLPLALAFDGFDGHLRFSGDAIAPHDGGASRAFVREMVRVHHHARPIVNIPAVVDAIRAARSSTENLPL